MYFLTVPHRQPDPRSSGIRSFKGDPEACLGGPASHGHEPVTGMFYRPGFKTVSVVFDDDGRSVLIAADRDDDAAGMAMPDGIVQRLLDDPEEMQGANRGKIFFAEDI